MIDPRIKKKYPPLEDEPFVIPDLSQMGNLSAMTDTGRSQYAPIDGVGVTGNVQPVQQYAPIAPPVGNGLPQNGGIPSKPPSITTNEPVNMGYGRTMENNPYPSLEAEQPFQPTAPVKQLTPLEIAQNKYEQAVTAPAHKQGKAAQIANFALQFIEDVFTPGQHEYEWLGNRKKHGRVDAAAKELAPLQAQETYKEKIRESRARTANYDADNQFQRDRLNQQKQEAVNKRIEAARKQIYSSKVHDPKNPAHRARMADAGLDPDTPGWDFSNPVKATVNGQSFDYNRVSGAWEPSGLPESEKDKLMDFEVSVPGEKNADGTPKIRKFRVPQGQAASLSASLQAAGMQIEAARDRTIITQQGATDRTQMQIKAQQELQANAQKYGREQTIKKAVDAFKSAYFKMHQKNPSKEEIDAYTNDVVITALGEVSASGGVIKP